MTCSSVIPEISMMFSFVFLNARTLMSAFVFIFFEFVMSCSVLIISDGVVMLIPPLRLTLFCTKSPVVAIWYPICPIASRRRSIGMMSSFLYSCSYTCFVRSINPILSQWRGMAYGF